MLLTKYEHINGSVKSTISRDDLISMTIDGHFLVLEGDNGEHVQIMPRNAHERHPNWEADMPDYHLPENMHLIDAGLVINSLQTHGIVVLTRKDDTHYDADIRYHPYPQSGE